jgi:low affinity Fe/Cu permease
VELDRAVDPGGQSAVGIGYVDFRQQRPRAGLQRIGNPGNGAGELAIGEFGHAHDGANARRHAEGSRQCGRPLTFGLAFGVIVVWAVSGPLFNYSDTWQLVINTATTIVTFLMVFLIQNTQNRDATAVQLKLDELIRVSTSARNKLLTLEDLTEAELDQMKKSFARIADRGGIGEGALREVEAGLEEAEEGIEKAKEKIAASKS